MTILELNEAVGGLSQTSKMPCPSWSVSAHLCKVGSKLATVAGSICSGCYAKNAAYNWASTIKALDRRLEAYNADPATWAHNMAELIIRKKLTHFRWFDSGDLQFLEMLERIVQIAESVPDCSFWLPTKEFGIVSQWQATHGDFPANLTVRLSAYMRDKAAPAPTRLQRLPSSTVTDKAAPIGYPCPSKAQGNQCGDCRACWHKSVQVVSYYWH